jgi:hypothetical protein
MWSGGRREIVSRPVGSLTRRGSCLPPLQLPWTPPSPTPIFSSILARTESYTHGGLSALLFSSALLFLKRTFDRKQGDPTCPALPRAARRIRAAQSPRQRCRARLSPRLSSSTSCLSLPRFLLDSCKASQVAFPSLSNLFPLDLPAMRFGMLALFALGSALGVVAQDGINFVEPQNGFGGSVRPFPCPELRLALYGVERHASELLRGLCFAGGLRYRAIAD